MDQLLVVIRIKLKNERWKVKMESNKIQKCKDCKFLVKSCFSRARTGQCQKKIGSPLINPLVAYNKEACSEFKNKLTK